MSAFTEANRKAFDDLAASMNTKPWQIKLANTIATALQARKDWLGVNWTSPEQKNEVRLLDYACGTGAITKALGSGVTEIRGIDISERMVEKYNETARSSGLSEQQANAILGDLCAEKVPDNLAGKEWFDFDVAAIGLGFHHFEHPDLAVKRLGERLRVGTGVLIIIDFLPFDHKKDEGDEEFKDMKHTIKHNGFTGDQMRDLYQAAGFEDFDIVALKEPAVLELPNGTVKRTLFIAKGRKAATAWQKLTSWVGGMQDWAASGSGFKMEADKQKWDPGFAKDGEVWSVSKQKDENYNAMEQNAPKSSWNGF